MKRKGLLALLLAWLSLPLTAAGAQSGAADAILFYDPGSPAGREILSSVLPPLLAQHGSRLQVFLVDVTTADGSSLFQSAVKTFGLASDQNPTPLAILDGHALSGLSAIREQLPGLVETALEKGGSPWPQIPGLTSALQKAGIIPVTPTAWQNFLNDQPPNSLAVLVIIGLIVSLAYSILAVFHRVRDVFLAVPPWVMPAFLLVGLCIAGYLSYTELTSSKVICGGILSGCNDVQNSQYSKLLGIIPVGVFGILGDSAIGIAWLLHRFTRGALQAAAGMAMLGFAVFGVSFSLYLTVLEPFVIGATCIWCLGSAIVMGCLLPLTAGPVRATIEKYNQGVKPATARTG